MFFNTIQRYRFFIERWGQKGLRDLRWNRWERRRKGCYFKDRGFGGCPNRLGAIS
nr:MAG TPA: hypothetical protein [Caudoviricetes sp.]DAT83376.1 MAG TPA: hypothetical protein [Caudoviricetes sp.]